MVVSKSSMKSAGKMEAKISAGERLTTVQYEERKCYGTEKRLSSMLHNPDDRIQTALVSQHSVLFYGGSVWIEESTYAIAGIDGTCDGWPSVWRMCLYDRTWAASCHGVGAPHVVEFAGFVSQVPLRVHASTHLRACSNNRVFLAWNERIVERLTNDVSVSQWRVSAEDCEIPTTSNYYGNLSKWSREYWPLYNAQGS